MKEGPGVVGLEPDVNILNHKILSCGYTLFNYSEYSHNEIKYLENLK